jgi:hypothetical protein
MWSSIRLGGKSPNGLTIVHIVLEDYIAAVEAAEARRDRLTAQSALRPH